MSTRVLQSGRVSQERRDTRRKAQREVALLAVTMEGGAVTQGMLVASRSWKEQGNDCPLVSCKDTALSTHFDFSPLRPALKF